MKAIKYLVLMTAVFACAVAVNMHRFGYNLNDGFWRTLMFPFEGTVWAPRFTEDNFNKIKQGMSASSVREILGEPLRQDSECSEICFWYYTGQDTGTADFDQRWIVFNNANQVMEIRKSFFID
ncbi:MAG: hypothetical protein A2X86_13995 [Bdellovibrionales bacterium GWA2_49_15]|nr:MAG: hypothetical protein A2X86_13995 [Bdellovibrionales bacterium GWA2_49_15]HAZ12727.1 hypothetical protein [Bdellovibrionales bacterium]